MSRGSCSFLSSDLMFSSRVLGAAKALGVSVQIGG